MIRFVMLMKLEVKKYIRSFPKLFAAAVILALIACGIGLTASRVLNSTSTDSVKDLIRDMTSENKLAVREGEKAAEEEEGGKISAALVIEDDSGVMKLARSMLEKMESVNAAIDLQYVNESEGEKLLEKEEVAVLMIIRENTAAGIMNGNNIPIEIRFPKNSGYEAAIFKEFADAAVNILSSAQAAIYSVYDFYDAYGKYGLRSGAIDRLNLVYIRTALERNEIYQEKEVVVTGELSVVQYYICGGLVLFAMFFSVMLVNFMGRAGRDISARLKMAGTGYLQQVTASLAGPACICMIFMAIAGAGVTALKFLQPEALAEISFGQIWGMVILMLPVFITVCAFALMVCRFTDHAMAQVMIIFILSLLQGFITGCFIPKLLLPEILEEISAFLPAYYMIELLSGIFTGEIDFGAVGMLIVFTLLFMEITVVLEKNANEKIFLHRRALS